MTYCSTTADQRNHCSCAVCVLCIMQCAPGSLDRFVNYAFALICFVVLYFFQLFCTSAAVRNPIFIMYILWFTLLFNVIFVIQIHFEVLYFYQQCCATRAELRSEESISRLVGRWGFLLCVQRKIIPFVKQ